MFRGGSEVNMISLFVLTIRDIFEIVVPTNRQTQRQICST